MNDRAFEFKEGTGITLTGNATEKSMTIAANPQVVNSTAGTETDKAPSVAATKGLIASDAEFGAGTAGKLVTAKQFRGVINTNNRGIIVDDANGNDATADGTEAKPYKTIQAAVNSIQPYTQAITISIKGGVYAITQSINFGYKSMGFVEIKPFSSDPVEIKLKCDSVSTNHLFLLHLNTMVDIQNIVFSVDDASSVSPNAVVLCWNAGNVLLYGCTFQGSASKKLTNGISVAYGTRAFAVNSSFSNAVNAITSTFSGVVMAKGCSSTTTENGLCSTDGGLIVKLNNVQPTGNVANEVTSGGGRII